MTPRTILIGLDGATFTVLDALMQEGVMPFLAGFTNSGVRAPLRSIIPALTPPAWTSLVTGRSPGQHGIFDFFRKESPHSHTIRLATARDLTANDSIWTVANQYGSRVIALNFPVMFPAPPIDGYIVPGWMPWRQLRLGCRPADLYDRLKALPSFNPRELAMDMTHEEKALEGCAHDEYEEWIALHTRREQHWFDILELLLNDDDSVELAAVLFDGVDKLQHLLWRFIDPAYRHTLQEAWEHRVSEICLDYFRELDKLLAAIAQRADPDTTIVLASDHGFGPQVRTFYLNAWLEQHGYLAWAEGDGAQPSSTKVLGVGQIARHGFLLNWQHTKAYAPLPSGNGIHIVQASDDHPHGVSETERDRLCDQIKAELLEVREPVSGEPVVAQVWKREEVFAGPCLNLAPDLTVVLQDGGLISILNSPEVVVPRPQPSGTHRPQGIFIARGPGLRHGTRLSELSILDVAPLILSSLSIPVPIEMEGRLPLEAFAPGFLQQRSTRRAAPTRSGMAEAAALPLATQPDVELSPEDEAEILQRMRSLGYVE